MIVRGHVRNGVVVPDAPEALPEGAEVRVEVVSEAGVGGKAPRRGGLWKGQVTIADDFDELPDDVAGGRWAGVDGLGSPWYGPDRA